MSTFTLIKRRIFNQSSHRLFYAPSGFLSTYFILVHHRSERVVNLKMREIPGPAETHRNNIQPLSTINLNRCVLESRTFLLFFSHCLYGVHAVDESVSEKINVFFIYEPRLFVLSFHSTPVSQFPTQ